MQLVHDKDPTIDTLIAHEMVHAMHMQHHNIYSNDATGDGLPGEQHGSARVSQNSYVEQTSQEFEEYLGNDPSDDETRRPTRSNRHRK